ncbi:MAG: transposase DNA-binding-containing protein [Planctomycetales bacterium]|nr:transposase DNA-binding-containing protein [Planctomycetales bacterium]
MSELVCEGVAGELLGNQRLNLRSEVVLEALAANPEASINAACEGWSDTLAAYRLFSNTAVTPEQTLRMADLSEGHSQPGLQISAAHFIVVRHDHHLHHSPSR